LSAEVLMAAPQPDPIWQDPHVRAFLADIIDHPDDDAPRLILADWLEEREQPLGTYLRAQVLLETEGDSSAAAGLKRKAAALYRKHGANWYPEFRDRVVRCTLRRGLLEKVHGGAGSLLDPALADSLAIHPIQCVKLTDPLGWTPLEQLQGVLELALLARIAELDLSGWNLDRTKTQALTAKPPFPRLRALRLRECNLNTECGLLLADWPGLATLRTLVLAGNRIRTAAIRALIASPHLGDLQLLDLRRNLMHAALERDLRARFGERVIF
jgi:uncharacterized protein (TIGR02996 family)